MTYCATTSIICIARKSVTTIIIIKKFRRDDILTGELKDLKQSFIKRLEKLDRKRFKTDNIISVELAKQVSALSKEVNRQIGLLIDRQNEVQYVIVGDNRSIFIPELKRFRLVPGKLRGLRLVHTHLYGEPINDDDITDLAMLRLDSLTAIYVDEAGLPKSMDTIYLLPPNIENKTYDYLDEKDVYNQNINFLEFIRELEKEIEDKTAALFQVSSGNNAILAGVFKSKTEAKMALEELKELARSAGLNVLDTVYQIRNKVDPKYLLGVGKLKDLAIKAYQIGADYIIFDNNLQPSQAKEISKIVELKIMDRTQLILDIFAKRAHTDEGKLKVELAQLKYIMPRLSVKDDSLSRLTGGIGGRGPGETKLEIDRRRIKDRIAFLNRKLKQISKVRYTQRKRRLQREIPTVSIVGYTNAGKTTLINSLTNSSIYADNLMFATLDTSSKRLRFPEEKEIIITDTVGFIRDLPEDLKDAFKSTLDELYDADLFLHVVDISNPEFRKQIESVNKILEELNLIDVEQILVFNKIDLLDEESLKELKNEFPKAIFISAINRKTFNELLNRIFYILFRQKVKNGSS
ncbi:small GTP-binding protein [Deferribacter desulfuricans SSM1]|uniref:GTPase HflX n=1 Tax=Deferribacter desulfuricans (strain DSM 14783 / JCM 11476 / NBRC 101012 / SSM1) TaxID=639282 RepID=D3P8L1_DEFDS|nr:GTPase HflX [Deferribacter desulfuricans]BAI81051.1 small GTP-binding protein [Deferribacter desulfuricans SSM1]